MSTVIIPARLASTRLARKALADIEGQPMVIRVVEQASKVRGVSRILVATDSEEIKSVVEKRGFEACITPELPSGTDRVAYVARNIVQDDVIVNIQGDEPLVHPFTVEAALHPVVSEGKLMGSVMTPFTSMEEIISPSCVKVLSDVQNNAIYFSRYAIPYRQNPISDAELMNFPQFGKHLGIYVYQRDFLLEFSTWEPSFIEKCESLEQLRALDRGIKIGMGRSHFGSQSVDTQSDLEKVRNLFREKDSQHG